MLGSKTKPRPIPSSALPHLQLDFIPEAQVTISQGPSIANVIYRVLGCPGPTQRCILG